MNISDPLIAAALFLLGLVSLFFAFKIRNQYDDVTGKKRIPLTGKGSKFHLFYVGIVFILLAGMILLKNT